MPTNLYLFWVWERGERISTPFPNGTDSISSFRNHVFPISTFDASRPLLAVKSKDLPKVNTYSSSCVIVVKISICEQIRQF